MSETNGHKPYCTQNKRIALRITLLRLLVAIGLTVVSDKVSKSEKWGRGGQIGERVKRRRRSESYRMIIYSKRCKGIESMEEDRVIKV